MSAARLRWIKFWPQDWHGNKELRTCSPAARGVWMDVLILAHSGEPHSVADVVNVSGAKRRVVLRLLRELENLGMCELLADGGIAVRRSPIEGGLRTDPDRLPWLEWKNIRQTVFDRDGHACTYCGAAGVALECDHIVPVSRGGGNEIENLATACLPCNRNKRDKMLGEWVRQ